MGTTVTRQVLARILTERLGCTESAARQYVGVFFKALSDAIIEGQRIEIRGFGAWEVRKVPARAHARNPRTGEQVFVPARQRVRFKAGKTVQTGLKKEEKRVRSN